VLLDTLIVTYSEGFEAFGCAAMICAIASRSLVHWDKSKNKWAAGITFSGKQYFLGRYAIEADAMCAYDQAAAALNESCGAIFTLNKELHLLHNAHPKSA
jgi:hypothetical protein